MILRPLPVTAPVECFTPSPRRRITPSTNLIWLQPNQRPFDSYSVPLRRMPGGNDSVMLATSRLSHIWIGHSELALALADFSCDLQPVGLGAEFFERETPGFDLVGLLLLGCVQYHLLLLLRIGRRRPRLGRGLAAIAGRHALSERLQPLRDDVSARPVEILCQLIAQHRSRCGKGADQFDHLVRRFLASGGEG